MSKFCGKCGSTLNENGLCPNCDSDKITAKKESSVNSQKNSEAVNKNRNDSQVKTYTKEPTEKEKKIKEKAEKATTKIKKKDDEKIGKIMAKVDKKAVRKSDKAAAKVKSKAENKTEKISAKFDLKAQKESNKVASRTIGQKIKWVVIKLVAIILVLIIMFSVVTGLLVYFDFVNVPFVYTVMNSMGIKNNDARLINISEYLDYSNKSNESEERMSAESYYNKNSKIINKISMNDSKNMMSEEEAYNLFQIYGFTECIIVSEYTENGEYSGPNEITPFSSNKHPVYRSDYVDEKGNLFEIYLIDGSLMANPVSFNAKTEENIKVVVSSSKTLKSYDSETKAFYETMPKNSIIRVQVASDSYIETLEKLAFEEGSQ